MVNTYKYLYILDGLDEISPDYISKVLNYAQSLKSDKKIYGIILSSRTDSFNLSFLYQNFPNIEKAEMLPLKEEDIIKYFQVRNNPDKIKKLNVLLKNNKSLIEDIDDVFSVSLLWDMIEKIDESTTKIDLCEQSVDRIINSYSKIARKNVNRKDFQASSSRDRHEMWARLQEIVKQDVTEINLSRLLTTFYEDNALAEKFKLAPAAKLIHQGNVDLAIAGATDAAIVPAAMAGCCATGKDCFPA